MYQSMVSPAIRISSVGAGGELRTKPPSSADPLPISRTSPQPRGAETGRCTPNLARRASLFRLWVSAVPPSMCARSHTGGGEGGNQGSV